MMRLNILGSSSNGNCYILDNGSEALVIEAGVDIAKVKKAVGFNLSRIVGCIVSHEHNDHAKFINQFVSCAISVLALPSVFDSKGVTSAFARPIAAGMGYKLGNYKIAAFQVCHDVPCVGYLVSHPDMGKLLFLTDTYNLAYRFNALNHIMIECNYADDILDWNIEHGVTPASMRSRLLMSHMALDTTKTILNAQDLSQVSNIILIHLSDDNSDEDRFVREVEEATGKIVVAADAGKVITLNY